MQRRTGLATRLIHHPGGICKVTGAVNTPIYQVSTFKQDAGGKNLGYNYSRTGNPTRQVLEEYIADLEGGSSGFAFASGMAAISAAIMLLRSGDHLIASEGLYGGSYRVLTQVFKDYEISCSFVDTSNLEQLGEAFGPRTRAILLETPSNPLLCISDIEAVASLAKERGALLIADNTFMTPLLQRPLEMGADVVVHSATKFLGGHSDLILGLVVTTDARRAARIKRLQNAMGAVPSPFDCWLLIRGMKTLGVRLGEAQRSATKIAEWLRNHAAVEKVYFPGFQDSEGFAVHRRQSAGPGAILSFHLADFVSVETFLSSLDIWTLAVSLGAVESIITQPSRMTHLSYPEKELKRLRIDHRLIRLSVGIEAVEDLILDLETALDRAV